MSSGASSSAVTVVTSTSSLLRQGVPDIFLQNAIELETVANETFTQGLEAVKAEQYKRSTVDRGYTMTGQLEGIIVQDTYWDKVAKKHVSCPPTHRPDILPTRVLDSNGEPVPLERDVEGNLYADLTVDIMIGTGTSDKGEDQGSSDDGDDVRDLYFKGTEHSKTFESNVFYALYEVYGQLQKLKAAKATIGEKYDEAMSLPPEVLRGHPDWVNEAIIPAEFKYYSLASLLDVEHLLKPPKNAEKAKRPAELPLEDNPADFWASVKKRLGSHFATVPDPAEKERLTLLVVQDVLRVASAELANLARGDRRRKAYMYDAETRKKPKVPIRPTIPKEKWGRSYPRGLWKMHVCPMLFVSFYACPRPNVKYVPGLPQHVRDDPTKWTKTIVYWKLMDGFLTPMEPVAESRLTEETSMHRALYMGDHTKELPDPKIREETLVTLRMVPSLAEELTCVLYKQYRAILQEAQKQVTLEPLSESDQELIPTPMRGLTEHVLRFLFTLEDRKKLGDMVFSMFPPTTALYDELCKREVIEDKEKKDSPKISLLHLNWAAHGLKLCKGPVFDEFTVPGHVLVNLNIQHVLSNIAVWGDHFHELFGVHPEDVEIFPVIYGILTQMDAIANSAKLPPLQQCQEKLAEIKDEKKRKFWRNAVAAYTETKNKITVFTGSAEAKKELEERSAVFEALLAMHVAHPYFPKEMAEEQKMILLTLADFRTMQTKIFGYIFSHAQEYIPLRIQAATFGFELDRGLFEIYARNREFASKEFKVFDDAITANGEPSRPAVKPAEPIVLPIPAAVAVRALLSGRLAKVGCLNSKELETLATATGVAPAAAAADGKKNKKPMLPARTALGHLLLANPSRKSFLMNSLLERATVTAKKGVALESPFDQAMQEELSGVLKGMLEAPNGKAWRAFAVNPFKADVGAEIVDYLLTRNTEDMGLLLDSEIKELRQKATYNTAAKNQIMQIMREKYHVGQPAMLNALSLADVWNSDALIYLAPPMPLAEEADSNGQRRPLTYQEIHQQREEAVLAYEALLKGTNIPRSTGGGGVDASVPITSSTQKVLANVAKFIKLASTVAPEHQMPSITNPSATPNGQPGAGVTASGTTPLNGTTTSHDPMQVDTPADTAALNQVAHDPDFQKALLGKNMLGKLGRDKDADKDGKKRQASRIATGKDDDVVPPAKRAKTGDAAEVGVDDNAMEVDAPSAEAASAVAGAASMDEDEEQGEEEEEAEPMEEEEEDNTLQGASS